MPRTPSKNPKKTTPFQRIKKIVERNKDKTDAMKKMLKVIENQQTQDNQKKSDKS